MCNAYLKVWLSLDIARVEQTGMRRKERDKRNIEGNQISVMDYWHPMQLCKHWKPEALQCAMLPFSIVVNLDKEER